LTFFTHTFLNILKKLTYITMKITLIILLIFNIILKIFNFRLGDGNNLSKQYFLVLKNIWYYENSVLSMESNDINNFKQMNTEELHFLIFSTESKITYLQVSNIFI